MTSILMRFIASFSCLMTWNESTRDERFGNDRPNCVPIWLIHVHNHVFDVLDRVSVQCAKIVTKIVFVSRGNDINDLICFEIKKDTCVLV